MTTMHIKTCSHMNLKLKITRVIFLVLSLQIKMLNCTNFVYVGLVSFSLKTIAHLRILDRSIDPSASVEEINAANKKMRDSWAERINMRVHECVTISRG